jgi:hypothetical protein
MQRRADPALAGIGKLLSPNKQFVHKSSIFPCVADRLVFGLRRTVQEHVPQLTSQSGLSYSSVEIKDPNFFSTPI